ncbi:MAG: hypothetical protein IKI31_02140, partial [Treponema sp.]|nr:hypothetical protein [Treponema sp.]
CVEVSARIDGKMSKKVYFFDLNGENFFKNVFIQGEKCIYKIENKFESFLNASENFWGEPFLIPKNISEKNHQTQNVQCITFLYYESEKIIHNNSHKFPKIANRLFELNHGKYFFEKIHPNEDSNENPIFELTVEYDTGELFFLQFQKYDAENYTVSYKIIDTFSHTTYDYDYTVFISTWTFSNIVDLFFKD